MVASAKFEERAQAYQSLVQDKNTMYLDFNKYGELEFISRSFDNELSRQVHQLWYKGQRKISSYFSQTSQLFGVLNRASKGEFNG